VAFVHIYFTEFAGPIKKKKNTSPYKKIKNFQNLETLRVYYTRSHNGTLKKNARDKKLCQPSIKLNKGRNHH